MSLLRNNTFLMVLVALIVIVPLALPIAESMEAPFSGADDQAEGVIAQVAPDYKPWFSSIWEPPSGEIESLLFALQAALGTGVLAYYIGLRRGMAKAKDEA
ncbi:MAG: energy-coupling factor ABC transporter substrate-binding protein [Rhodospirillaceae bacterium]|nr:energy-coupling factor ABC transporter substrate-binding protein [Rhodospirillaceae bacterium]